MLTHSMKQTNKPLASYTHQGMCSQQFTVFSKLSTILVESWLETFKMYVDYFIHTVVDYRTYKSEVL